MSLQAHLNELITKHKHLEKQLKQALGHPGTSDLELAEIKRKKLVIKDEITRLEEQLKAA